MAKNPGAIATTNSSTPSPTATNSKPTGAKASRESKKPSPPLRPKTSPKTVAIRGEPHSIPLALHRSLAHTAYHCGQIILIARILAGDNWNVITIPRGGSAAFNQNVWGKGHYQTRSS